MENERQFSEQMRTIRWRMTREEFRFANEIRFRLSGDFMRPRHRAIAIGFLFSTLTPCAAAPLTPNH